MEDNIKNILGNMIKNKVKLDNIPIVIADYSAQEIVRHVSLCFEKYKTFKMVRWEQIYLAAPLSESVTKWNEWFELFNKKSNYQNRTYGIAELDFCRWVGQSIPKEILIQLFDFMIKNTGNCIFVLSNVSEQIPDEFKLYNCIFDSKKQNPIDYINAKCSDHKVEIEEPDKAAIEQLLLKNSYSEWGVIWREIVNELYQNNMKFDANYLETFDEKRLINTKKIGF